MRQNGQKSDAIAGSEEERGVRSVPRGDIFVLKFFGLSQQFFRLCDQFFGSTLCLNSSAG